MAPIGSRATSIGLAYAVMDAFGYGVGGTLGAHTYESCGAQTLFRAAGVLALASAVANVAVQKLVGRRKSSQYLPLKSTS